MIWIGSRGSVTRKAAQFRNIHNKDKVNAKANMANTGTAKESILTQDAVIRLCEGRVVLGAQAWSVALS